MIVFRNPGLIDLAAVRNMGVSVKLPGSFGYFGTGMKFSIASVLRGGGRIELWRGLERHDFTTVRETIRGEKFDVVCMDGVPMGFTTQLGRNWEPWMVLRELGCNALDEAGSFYQVGRRPRQLADETETTIVVRWDALDEAYKQRRSIFCALEGYSQVLATEQVQVLEGESQYLFYRGVRAYKLQRPSAFTYNILSEQALTEDRTIAQVYYPQGEVRAMWLACEDRDALVTALTSEDKWEGQLDFTATNRKPSRTFVDVVLDGRRHDWKGLIQSAINVVMKQQRRDRGDSYVRSRRTQDALDRALEIVGEMFGDDQLDMDNAHFIVVPELENDKTWLVDNDQAYLSEGLLAGTTRDIVEALIRCRLEQVYVDERDMFITAILETDSRTRKYRADQESAMAEEADEEAEASPVEPVRAPVDDEVPYETN